MQGAPVPQQPQPQPQHHQQQQPDAPFTSDNVVAALHTLHNDPKFYDKANR
jgi:hypothetical protein